MKDAIRLDGMVAIITGGAGGIGMATAQLMAARGARLVIADLATEQAKSFAATLPDSIGLPLDLADEKSIIEMVSRAVDHFGKIDILHNNAAYQVPQKDGDIARMNTEVWDMTFAVNARGTMIACREALPHLAASRGAIINMVSNLAVRGHMIQAAYSASKAAVIQLTRAIAASHGRLGVRCNAVAPGMTSTPALEAAFPPVLRAVVEEETLRGMLGSPDDIAQAVAFLASPAAANITGEVLVSDGGTISHVPGLPAFQKFFSGAPQ